MSRLILVVTFVLGLVTGLTIGAHPTYAQNTPRAVTVPTPNRGFIECVLYRDHISCIP
jgi:hypothetical protein